MIIITESHIKKIILIIGPPQNGVELLKSGLNFLCHGDCEGEPILSADNTGPSLINENQVSTTRLFSERVGSMTPSWNKMKDSGRVMQDIRTYLKNCIARSAPLFLGYAHLYQVLPLWLEVIKELGIEPQIIHLSRHPWEVAQALYRYEGLDLDSGHRFWLSCYRDAAMTSLEYKTVIVAYEQLLENPCQVFHRISDALCLSYIYDLQEKYPLQLSYFLQTQKRDFDADNMSSREKELYSIFYRLYNKVIVDKNEGNHNKISRDLRKTLKRFTRSDLYPTYCAKMDQFYRQDAEKKLNGMDKGKTFWDTPIKLIPQDYFSSSIYAFGLIKPALTSFLVDFLKPGWTVIDVGAHLGYISMLAAALVRDEGKVVSFEPALNMVEILKENLKAYPRAYVVPKLAWHKEESVYFKVHDLAHSHENKVLHPDLDQDQEISHDNNLTLLQGFPLDAYCIENDINPDLVNVDIKGSERQVLEGMAALFVTGRPVVTLDLESSLAWSKRMNTLFQDIANYVQGYNYVALESVGYRLHVKMNYDQNVDYDNIILVPEEKLALVGIK